MLIQSAQRFNVWAVALSETGTPRAIKDNKKKTGIASLLSRIIISTLNAKYNILYRDVMYGSIFETDLKFVTLQYIPSFVTLCKTKPPFLTKGGATEPFHHARF